MSWAIPGIVTEMNDSIIRYDKSFSIPHRKFSIIDLVKGSRLGTYRKRLRRIVVGAIATVA